MHAIVSLLDDHHYDLLESLWQDLEYECGLTGIAFTPIPHLSWHIAAEYDFKRLERSLAAVAEASSPFTFQTRGLGVFSGISPVIYIPVIKDIELARFHSRIWETGNPTAIGASLHYAPDAWMPHLTLAYGDVDRQKLGCAMEKLAFQTFEWEIQVDHLALVYQFSGQVGKIQYKFPFGGARGG
jgi:2'-5' RNA ligase